MTVQVIPAAGYADDGIDTSDSERAVAKAGLALMPDRRDLHRGRRSGPGVGEQRAGVAQQLREHLGPRDDRHEVRVAAPARYDVLVEVRRDAGAGDRRPGSCRC